MNDEIYSYSIIPVPDITAHEDDVMLVGIPKCWGVLCMCKKCMPFYLILFWNDTNYTREYVPFYTLYLSTSSLPSPSPSLFPSSLSSLTQIWLDSVECNGTENSIFQCNHSNWGNTNCDHTQDASAICTSEP